mmetsp:Transcript_11660/g.31270  ORF Transcript_11660/g.31270 Transcript_11660/m.31270 type:complete len:352 (-) Transcript_11660:370-1425(-)
MHRRGAHIGGPGGARLRLGSGRLRLCCGAGCGVRGPVSQLSHEIVVVGEVRLLPIHRVATLPQVATAPILLGCLPLLPRVNIGPAIERIGHPVVRAAKLLMQAAPILLPLRPSTTPGSKADLAIEARNACALASCMATLLANSSILVSGGRPPHGLGRASSAAVHGALESAGGLLGHRAYNSCRFLHAAPRARDVGASRVQAPCQRAGSAPKLRARLPAQLVELLGPPRIRHFKQNNQQQATEHQNEHRHCPPSPTGRLVVHLGLLVHTDARHWLPAEAARTTAYVVHRGKQLVASPLGADIGPRLGAQLAIRLREQAASRAKAAEDTGLVAHFRRTRGHRGRQAPHRHGR